MRESKFLTVNNDLLGKIKQIPSLIVFSDEELSALLTYSKLRTYEPGEVIFKENSYDAWIYFLISGRVRLLRDGRELRTLRRRGDLFGEMSVIDGMPRSATVVAENETTCLAVDASLLDNVQDTAHTAFHYVLYRFFAEILAERLRDTNAELVQIKERYGEK